MSDAIPAPSLDVVALGNALVDVLSHEADDFLDAHGLTKGAMALIDAEQAEVLYGELGPAVEVSGGSAANTTVGIASLGGRSAFIGRTRDDQLGEVFGHDIRAAGVRFDTPPATSGPPTGRCLIVVTPDAQRTLNTFLGAASELHPDDVHASLVQDAAVTYLEGYLFDQDAAKAAFRQAAALAHEAGRQVALTLSDSFCVARHRDDFLALVEHEVDVLFANEDEVCALYETDFDTAVERTRGHVAIAALTRSEQGSVVIGPEGATAVPAHPLLEAGLVDTTGAGDLYAAGFLYGLTHGHDLERCARLGSVAAAEVISHLGPRPLVSLAELAAPLLR
jgi:sugar/nucleoside kinase (ribokinase family)